MHDLLSLSTLRAGQLAVVRQVVGQPEHVRRMEELGMRDGAMLEIVRAGTPCIVRIGESRLCFRDGELMSVLVSLRKSA